MREVRVNEHINVNMNYSKVGHHRKTSRDIVTQRALLAIRFRPLGASLAVRFFFLFKTFDLVGFFDLVCFPPPYVLPVRPKCNCKAG
jgi:hypothetical protein